jgi:hypothetical protein
MSVNGRLRVVCIKENEMNHTRLDARYTCNSSRAAPIAACAALSILATTLSGCDRSSPPANPVNYVPTGSAQSVIEACTEAGLLLEVMDNNNTSPTKASYLDPRSLPGYDPQKTDHNNRASSKLLTRIADQYPKDKLKLANLDGLIYNALEANGWKKTGEKQFEASEFSWTNLENRVNWCVDHYQVNIVEAAAPASAAQTPAFLSAPWQTQQATPVASASVEEEVEATSAVVDPYRTERFPGIDGVGEPIVIEHQPE